MSKFKDLENVPGDQFSEHVLHTEYNENCSTCYSEENPKFACDICEDTGEVDVDYQNSDGHWERGTDTRKCECQIDTSCGHDLYNN